MPDDARSCSARSMPREDPDPCPRRSRSGISRPPASGSSCRGPCRDSTDRDPQIPPSIQPAIPIAPRNNARSAREERNPPALVITPPPSQNPLRGRLLSFLTRPEDPEVPDLELPLRIMGEQARLPSPRGQAHHHMRSARLDRRAPGGILHLPEHQRHAHGAALETGSHP